MDDLYTSLQVSPRKKRCPPDLDDANVMTPKKLRTAPPTPPASSSRQTKTTPRTSLPDPLARLLNIHTALQHALSHALATCAISPTHDSGIVRNVLNHISLTTYSGFNGSFDLQDLRKLCWIWEWDGQSVTGSAPQDEEDNPFLEGTAASATSTEWTRGSMGLVLSPATHYSKTDRKRVPAYGVGIEVEMDIDKEMGGGMAAVARWTSEAETRRTAFCKKLERWVALHPNASPIPDIPLADVPGLAAPKVSALTRTLASCSPSAISATHPPAAPSSPSRSPTKKSTREFAIPFPILEAQKSPTKRSAALFPQTPSRRILSHDSASPLPPQTPSSINSSPSRQSPEVSTPVRHTGSSTTTPAQTPSTSRRQALYERIRHRSLSKSPTKQLGLGSADSKVTRDQMLKMGQDEMRRRCLLGRLGGIAESIWMLFSNPTASSSLTPSSRKRRALPSSEIITAVIKSSPVPISAAEANESLLMLIKLCPFFVRKLEISGQEWIEMPANSAAIPTSVELSPTKTKTTTAASSSRLKGKDDSARELLTRSPRRVGREGGGLREVREIIRRELELQD